MSNLYERVMISRLGISLDPMGPEAVVKTIVKRHPSCTPVWISNYNLHALYLHLTDQEFRRSCNKADIFLIDGWPILQLARIYRRRMIPSHTRIGSTDWLEALLRSGAAVTITSIAATPHSARRAGERIAAEFPHVHWYAFDGYELQPQGAGTETLSWLEAVAISDLVLVGRGMPAQEHWIADVIDRPEFGGCVVANVGGCIDYISGVQELAPRWVGRLGMEWMYRLARSPRRLAYRYLIEPVLLALHLLRQIISPAPLEVSPNGRSAL